MNNTPHQFLGTTIDLGQVPHKVERGRTFVQIDDMRFPVLGGVDSAFTGPRWTNGSVYYIFDAAVTTAHRQAWRDAAADWSAVASLTFIEGQGIGNYIYVQNSEGNNSFVGMIGGEQVMNIFNWGFEFIIAHEIGHALGAIHEHQRSGRDSFVQILTGNIQAGSESQFTIRSSTNYGTYDFDSVMHYDECAFSIDCPAGSSCNCTNITISVLPPNDGQWQDAIGQRDHLSQLDQSGMAQRYGGGTPTPTPTVPPCGVALSQNFDGVAAPALPTGWVASNPNPGDGTPWGTSTAAPDTAPNDAFIPDQNGISDKVLDTPSIAINSASAQLNFRNNFNTEFDGVTYWDGGVLEVSSPNINGGAFTDITDPAVGGSFIAGGYTGTISSTANNPLSGRMAWSGSSAGYVNTVANLGPNVSGQTIRLRFRMGTDEAVSAPGWRVDTVSVAGGTCATTTTLGNISTRLRVETGNDVLIGGFIISGTQAKRVIVRAIGPSLSLAGALSDPTLELRNSSGGLIALNDNWRSSQEAEIIGTGIPPSNILESAIVATLPANNSAYTAVVRGNNNATGIGVVEAYDLDQTGNSKLANISTRGFVNTGNNVMIGGMIVTGSGSARILLRAIGPSLLNAGVPNALPDPTLDLRNASGTLIAFNDDWRDSQQAEIIATGIPPTNNLESAIVRDLSPGAYTAIVKEFSNLTGVGLVEAYQLQ